MLFFFGFDFLLAVFLGGLDLHYKAQKQGPDYNVWNWTRASFFISIIILTRKAKPMCIIVKSCS